MLPVLPPLWCCALSVEAHLYILYQKGLEMPNRILKESICTSDSIEVLSWFEEVLFYRLIVKCDDYGRYDGRPAIIKGNCFPLKDVTNKDIEKALDKLSAAGLVRVYEAQGRPYLQLVTWERHQTIRAKKSKYPAIEETCMQMQSDACKCSRYPIQSESKSKSITVSNDTVRQTDVQRVIESWNRLEELGIKGISRLGSGTKRYDSICARIKEYGIDEVIAAIERIKNSDFLCGKGAKGWTITFDWFVLPNNFPKVHDGNYDNGNQKNKSSVQKPPPNRFHNFAQRDTDYDALVQDQVRGWLDEAGSVQKEQEGGENE